MFRLISFLTSFLFREESPLGGLRGRGSLGPRQPPLVPAPPLKTPRDPERRGRRPLTYLSIVPASRGSPMVRTDLFGATSLRETSRLGCVSLPLQKGQQWCSHGREAPFQSVDSSLSSQNREGYLMCTSSLRQQNLRHLTPDRLSGFCSTDHCSGSV